MMILGLYQSWGSGNGFSGKHRKLNFIDLRQSHDAPAPGTGKAGGTRENMRALRNPACWSCSFQTLAGMQTQQLLVLLTECAPILLPSSPSSKDSLCCTHLAFAGAGAAASRASQRSEMGKVRSSARALLMPQQFIFLWSSMVCRGLQPVLNSRMLLADGAIFHCHQSAIVLRTRTMHQPFVVNAVTEMTPLLSAIQGFPSSERTFC